MTTSSHQSVTIRMGAAHSTLEVQGTKAPIDLSKASTRDLWEIGCRLSYSMGLKGKTPGVKANTKPDEPLITLPPAPKRKHAYDRMANGLLDRDKKRKDRNPNGKPHHAKGQAPGPKDDHKPRRTARPKVRRTPPSDGATQQGN